MVRNLRKFRPFDPLKATRPVTGSRNRAITQFDISQFTKMYQTRDLEIGAGVGWNAISSALKAPNRGLIALERTTEKSTKAFSRISSHFKKGANLSNLYYFQTDALQWIPNNIPPLFLDRVFILYPNLELKRPNQRFLRSSFFEFLLTRLKKEFEIEMATNSESYFDEAKRFAEKQWLLQVEWKKITKKTHPHFLPRTHFEKKYYLQGETLFLFTLRPKS